MGVATAGRSSGSARALAARAVMRVLEQGETLERALEVTLAALEPPAAAALAPSVRSLSFGAVRGFYRHQAFLGALLAQPVSKLEPAVRSLLSVALFELEDGRTPEYAVVDAAVETARSLGAGRAAALVNAVLRRFLRERSALEARVGRKPAARYGFPEALAARARADWPTHWQELLAASDAQGPLWLRVNARRSSTESFVEGLRAAGIEARAESSVPYAVVLAAPRDVHEVPGFAEGAVSVQDLGAQCVAFPLALEPGQRVLDACAAPGGKTGLMAEREPGLAGLTAVDLDPRRLAHVRENLDRLGLAAELIAADVAAPEAWWDGRPFDRILLDAPCSALGVVRRHPDIRLRRTAGDIDRMPRLQGRLLTAAWRLLAPGGRLVYATCTWTRSENRDLIRAFLEGTADARVVPSEQWPHWPQIGVADECGRQILPGEAGADGFYYAALCKR